VMLSTAVQRLWRLHGIPAGKAAVIVGEPERAAEIEQDLRESGHLILQASLGPTRATMSLRPKGGKPAVTDGPFAETKEQVGGFFIIEARDLNEAIRVASKHPAAHLGERVGWGIEVRPIEGFEQR